MTLPTDKSPRLKFDDEKKLPWWRFGCTGGAVGGCLVPFVLMLILGMGGPLFWPIVSIPLALIGLFFDTIVWLIVWEKPK
jgi:hypothetical protein